MLADDSEAILSNTPPENLQSAKTYGSTKTWFDVGTLISLYRYVINVGDAFMLTPRECLAEAIMYDDLDALFPRNQRLTARTMPASKLFGSDANTVQLPLHVDTPIERSNEVRSLTIF